MRQLPLHKALLNSLLIISLSVVLGYLSLSETGKVLGQDILYETVVDSPVITAEWSPDGSLLAVGTTTGGRIYDRQLQEIGTLPDTNERIISLSWDPTSARLAGVQYPHDREADPAVPLIVSSLLVWQRNPDDSFTLQYQMDYPDTNNIVSVTWSPDGQMLAAAEEERIEGTLTFIGRITVWDTNSWSMISETANTYDYIGKPIWSPDSATIASSGVGLCNELKGCRSDEAQDLYVYFFSDPLTGDRISFENIAATPHLAWSSNNQLALAYGALEVLDFNTDQSYLYDNHRVFVVKTAWLPDHNLLLQVYPDEVRKFNLFTGETIRVYTVANLTYMTVTPDGNPTLITDDNRITIRTLGEPVVTPTKMPTETANNTLTVMNMPASTSEVTSREGT